METKEAKLVREREIDDAFCNGGAFVTVTLKESCAPIDAISAYAYITTSFFGYLVDRGASMDDAADILRDALYTAKKAARLTDGIWQS